MIKKPNWRLATKRSRRAIGGVSSNGQTETSGLTLSRDSAGEKALAIRQNKDGDYSEEF